MRCVPFIVINPKLWKDSGLPRRQHCCLEFLWFGLNYWLSWFPTGCSLDKVQLGCLICICLCILHAYDYFTYDYMHIARRARNFLNSKKICRSMSFRKRGYIMVCCIVIVAKKEIHSKSKPMEWLWSVIRSNTNAISNFRLSCLKKSSRSSGWRWTACSCKYPTKVHLNGNH